MAPPGFRPALPSSALPPPEPATRASEEEATVPTIREVEVAGRRVLMTRLPSGEVVAFAASCPHLGTPLHRAELEGEHIRCPQHRYVYDPRSGRNISPAQEVSAEELKRLRPGRLSTFPALEEDGWVWVGEAPSAEHAR